MVTLIMEIRLGNMKTNKLIIFTVIIIILFFFFQVIFSILKNEDKTLKIEDEINVYAKNIKYKKGVITINDSIALHGNALFLDDNYKSGKRNNSVTLAKFEGPYRIVKKRNNDTLFVIISNDTLYFKFIDPDYKDPNDPTFPDLFERLLIQINER